MTDDELVRLYTQEHLTLREIGPRAGISATAVWRRLQRLGVPSHAGEWVQLTCDTCGRPFERTRSVARSYRHFCQPGCYFAWRASGEPYRLWRQGMRKARALVATVYPLQPGMVVHHHDRDCYHNNLPNLAVFTDHAAHMQYHHASPDAPLPLWDGRDLIT